MRISDWSSDVCSSDLTRGTGEVMTPIENNPPATCPACGCTDAAGAHAHAIAAALIDDDLDRAMTLGLLEPVACIACPDDCSNRRRQAREARKSEERRVGKEGVSKWSSRWTPYP